MNAELNAKDQAKRARWNEKVHDESNKRESMRLQQEMAQRKQEQQQFARAQKQEYNNVLGYQAQEAQHQRVQEKVDERNAFNQA